MNEKRLTTTVAGKEISFETGKIARQANGAVMVRSGDTIVFASACGSKNRAPDVDFLPLRVDYQEKMSSAGRTLGGYIKREGRPTERETLVCRLIDRPIRPMFPEGFFNEVQIITTVFSYDNEHPPEPLAICAASAALLISDIPFYKPVAAVRVGMKGGEFIINPSISEQKDSVLDLVLAGTKDAILMIEGYCDFLTEEQVIGAIDEGHKAIKHICEQLSDWQNLIGKEKFTPDLVTPSKELLAEISKQTKEKFLSAYQISQKEAREAATKEIEVEIKAKYLESENAKHSPLEIKLALKNVSASILREKVINEKKRTDGRGFSDIRNITIEPSLLPRTHGSVLFTRGETQVIAVCTLGGSSMNIRYEDLNGEGDHDAYLQYTFPPYSVGEVGRMGAPGRREVGHGKLAERAIMPLIKAIDKTIFPYSIRIESNVTESNGSSSMASVCGACLSMMDAGVPILRPVSGIAMGLILEENEYVILSDILGLEDALGDMDFKITGDGYGITAFQMDIKVEGINPKIMEAALMQAKEGRIHILKKMIHALPTSRNDISEFAPRLISFPVKQSKIGTIVGPGGKMIRAIMEDTGATIDIDDNGMISLSADNAESIRRAKETILDLVAEVELGAIYKGPVVNIATFGAFVRLPGQKDGLLHISEISHERVNNVEDLLKEGDIVEVKVLEINDRGQIKLSRKVLLEKPKKETAKAQA